MTNENRVTCNDVALALMYLAIVGLTLWFAESCMPQVVPCSESDSTMLLHAAECRARVRTECVNIPDDQCPAVRECDAWGRARCGLPPAAADVGTDADGGSAGAK